MKNFHSIYSHHFIRVSACIPYLKVADPVFNVDHIIELAMRASKLKSAIALFPELSISSYSADDLLHQQALLNAVIAGIGRIVEASRELTPVLQVGAPLQLEGKLFNCALVIYRGRILGIVPKTYLPNYREFYEKRQFTPAHAALTREVSFLGHTVPFGADLIFNATNFAHFSFHTEICEDLWTPLPPSTYAALAGATVLTNLSASNITIGKADYRRNLCAMQSSKCLAAYMYAAAGPGESTTDLAWDGHAMIYENHQLLAESERFSDQQQIITADIDLERLIQDRMRTTSFNDTVQLHREQLRSLRRIEFEFAVPEDTVPLHRPVARFPYVPDNPAKRDEHCYEAYQIQVHGLMKRLAFTKTEQIVIGVSGGLDSAHALIAAAHTMDRLELPRTNILAYTLPGFATGEATRANAHRLMAALGVTGQEIDIRPSCLQMLKDIEHPFTDGKPQYDIAFENVQAGERSSHLFRLANFHHALVLGTGDLSELALGWCTYGVGDHMSHYNINASVPKTLIQHLIRWTIGSRQFNDATNEALAAILDTEISPELIPTQSPDKPLQSTQQIIGPYELQDFNLYYVTRFGFRPEKIAFLANHAWGNRLTGHWPDGITEQSRNEYDLATIKQWLGVFLSRFFQTSQFKRSCIPNAPKVGSGGSLSPRGDWRAPSDAEAKVWLDELKLIP
ncbi:NAD(+) synthase [Nitrosomonas sp.]|uniref:NAD(+) synthase n=1 Tax=Nitrosomonas sp. TaxID=42353 RepID=UPI001D7337B4|nr:NAD(+) synthase [Nitrosomonas sp.]MBX3617074.1 NAD(+) synthase [Nitrosomonas sp.]